MIKRILKLNKFKNFIKNIEGFTTYDIEINNDNDFGIQFLTEVFNNSIESNYINAKYKKYNISELVCNISDNEKTLNNKKTNLILFLNNTFNKILNKETCFNSQSSMFYIINDEYLESLKLPLIIIETIDYINNTKYNYFVIE